MGWDNCPTSGGGLGQMSCILAVDWDNCPEFWRWVGKMTNLLIFSILKVSCRPAAADAAGKNIIWIWGYSSAHPNLDRPSESKIPSPNINALLYLEQNGRARAPPFSCVSGDYDARVLDYPISLKVVCLQESQGHKWKGKQPFYIIFVCTCWWGNIPNINKSEHLPTILFAEFCISSWTYF